MDLDPQAHATMALGCALDGEPSVHDVLMGEVAIERAIQPAPGRIALLPAERALVEFEEVSERLLNPERRLAEALDRVAGRYPWVLVDCPPRADGVLCANALFASTVALLVVETGAFALQGALQALRVLEETAERQGREFDIRVVGTMFDRRTKFARELLVALHGRFGPAMFDTVIRTSVRLREAPAWGVPIQELAPGSRAATDFAALAAEIVAKAPTFGASVPAAGSGSPKRPLAPEPGAAIPGAPRTPGPRRPAAGDSRDVSSSIR